MSTSRWANRFDGSGGREGDRRRGGRGGARDWGQGRQGSRGRGLPRRVAPRAGHLDPSAGGFRSRPKRPCTRPSARRWSNGRGKAFRPIPGPGWSRPGASRPSTPSAAGRASTDEAAEAARFLGRRGPDKAARRSRRRMRTAETDGRRETIACASSSPAAIRPWRRSAGRPDLARSVRPDHGGDRPRLPDRAAHHRPAHRARQGQDPRGRIPYESAGPRRSCPNGWTRCCASSIWSSTKAIPPSSGDAVTRADLSGEAIRLGRLLVELLPEPGSQGPAGPDAAAGIAPRRPALRRRRAGPAGGPGSLPVGPGPDRARARPWSKRPCGPGASGPYTLQAAIAAVHAEAAAPKGATDWRANRRPVRRAAARRRPRPWSN